MPDSEPDQERRRRRPAVRRKIRCNRELPCSNCVRSKITANCVYDKFPTSSQTQHDKHRQISRDRQNNHVLIKPVSERDGRSTLGAPKHQTSSSNGTITLSPKNQSFALNSDQTNNVESMKRRIKELEDQLLIKNKSAVPSPTLTPKSVIFNTEAKTSLSGSFHVHKDSRPFGKDPPVVATYGVLHKTRLLGQSHWINGVTGYHDLFEILEPHIQEGSKAAAGIQKCKTLGKLIKARRAPRWPSPPTWPDLPSKDIADRLVDCYLRTIETIYRVVHVPTFRNNYEAIWTSTGKPDTEFLVQLKLVLAIGTVTYDDKFSLRASAIRWVYEAQTWISEPEFKSRLTMKSLQTELLLLFARDTVGVGGKLIWTSAGSLFRSAVYMGLHRDPDTLPKRTIFAAEMRRRLWNTILELMLQSSMDSGGPPLISLTDWDTEAPRNFDDDELLTVDAVPRPENEYSQTSLAIILRKTFPLRLAIAKYLNDFSTPSTFEEAIKLDTELRSSYKVLCQDIQRFNPSNGILPSQFGVQMLNVIMLRYLLSLHVPFFVSASQSPAYSFSRKVVLETCLKLWYLVYPPLSMIDSQSHEESTTSDQNYLPRLTVCGSGLLRTIAIQAGFIIALELKIQLKEETSLGPISLRPDLVNAIKDAKIWNLRCIEAGEVNMKGYLFVCLGMAHIDALRRGQIGEELAASLVSAAEEAIQECTKLLENMAAQGQHEGGVAADGLSQMSLATPPELMEDWDFMMTDAQYNFGDALGWAFNYDNSQELSLW